MDRTPVAARLVVLGSMWAATAVTGGTVEPSVDNLARLEGCWQGAADEMESGPGQSARDRVAACPPRIES